MAGTDLVLRATIEELIGHRDRAIARFSDAFKAMADAQENLRKAAPSEKYGSGFCLSDDYARHGRGRKQEPADIVERFRRETDRQIWRHLLFASQLATLMDQTAREAFEAQLEENPPPCTVETCAATMRAKLDEAPEIFRRGIVTAFQNLSRDYKSHDGFKVGPRLILQSAVSACCGFGWNHYSKTGETIRDIDRIFHILDDKPAPERMAGIDGAIAAKFRTEERQAENAYMRARWHKNGTLHLWFLRDDLRQKANRLIAEHFGEAIGAGYSARRAAG